MWDKILGYLSGGSKGILGGIEGILDETITTQEEKLEAKAKITALQNSHTEALKAFVMEEMANHTQEMGNARAREVELNKSPYTNWLGKNTSSILAYVVVVLTFVLMGFLLFGSIPKEKENLAFAIQGFLAGACMTVLGYYFGSTHGSQRKDDTIKELVNTGTNTEAATK